MFVYKYGFCRNKKRGITLAEICIVLALISIITVMITSFTVMTRSSVYKANADSNIKTNIENVDYALDIWLSSIDSSDYTITIVNDVLIASDSSNNDYMLKLENGKIVGSLPYYDGPFELDASYIDHISFSISDAIAGKDICFIECFVRYTFTNGATSDITFKKALRAAKRGA